MKPKMKSVESLVTMAHNLGDSMAGLNIAEKLIVISLMKQELDILVLHAYEETGAK